MRQTQRGLVRCSEAELVNVQPQPQPPQIVPLTPEQEIKILRERQLLGIKGCQGWVVRIVLFLLLIATIIVVYVVGRNTGEVSRQFKLYVTPDDLFFFIWAVIFALQVIANIINLFRNIWTLPEYGYLGTNYVLLVLWIVLFNQGTLSTIIAAFFLLIFIVPFGLALWYRLGKLRPYDWFTYFARNVYAFYLGWIVVAINLNLGILIVYWFKGSYNLQVIIFWIVAPLMALLVTIFNLYRQGLFGFKCCFALWISAIWGFIGAAISSRRCLMEGC